MKKISGIEKTLLFLLIFLVLISEIISWLIPEYHGYSSHVMTNLFNNGYAFHTGTRFLFFGFLIFYGFLLKFRKKRKSKSSKSEIIILSIVLMIFVFYIIYEISRI